MPPALLLTQCLQRDMVAPLGRYDAVPNRLHVGYAEALRLMGEDPAQGPLARAMRWAYAQPDEVLRVVHLRDWHDPADPDQASHLRQFGPHCLRDTPGAAFAFPEPATTKAIEVVDSLTLNDFVGTRLAELLDPWRGQPLRVGLVGVWTEAKVTFLAYELRTRYPSFEVAVCSALTASSSRAHHFAALDQLERLLGVHVVDALGDFVRFLGGDDELPLPVPDGRFPELHLDGSIPLADDDRALARYLFRDCREVHLKVLTGGFSGNVVCATDSVDLHGQSQVPHVLKIGERAPIGRERTAFERVQHVLGNNAPAISDFADLGERGAIKYRYASMGGRTTSFQRAWQAGEPLDRLERVLDAVFGEQLHRFYRAATLESVDLLDHYAFSPRWGPSLRRAVARIVGHPAAKDTVDVLPGVTVPHVARFYEHTLAHLPPRPRDQVWTALVHGDLNGQNILLDGHDNVWLVDFFHTRRAHVLMDLAKLENDLLYLFTPVGDEPTLREALRLTDALLDVQDLAAPLPERAPSDHPALRRAWAGVRKLRGFHADLVRSDRDPLQLLIAQLRYAGHTLSFDEPTPLQHRWALYTAGRLVERLDRELTRSARLRLDAVDPVWDGPGRLSLTLLPGRQDRERDLQADLAVLRDEGVTRVLTLVPRDELAHYGVGHLVEALGAAGLRTLHLPIVDQHACSLADAHEAVRFVREGVDAGEHVLVHCVGGLGRSGMVAACALVAWGLDAEAAIAAVRRARGPRAVETAEQEALVRAWAG